jgi:hypothetical protein
MRWTIIGKKNWPVRFAICQRFFANSPKISSCRNSVQRRVFFSYFFFASNRAGATALRLWPVG